VPVDVVTVDSEHIAAIGVGGHPDDRDLLRLGTDINGVHGGPDVISGAEVLVELAAELGLVELTGLAGSEADDGAVVVDPDEAVAAGIPMAPESLANSRRS
jgi:hypothetical protein